MTKPRPAEPSRWPHDRSVLATLWYRAVQTVVSVILAAFFGIRITGRGHLPREGAALLISNHASHLDVFALGVFAARPLNYVARSTLFIAGLGAFIRSVGGFPIQREGLGASGMKETLRRLRNGGIVVLFPEGTRTRDGRLGEIKAGISLLATRAGVAIIPATVAGTFESWPRSRLLPSSHPIRVHFGLPIGADEAAAIGPEALTETIRDRLLACQAEAHAGLLRDLCS